MPVTYLTHADLYRDTLELATRLPRDIVGIAGVPRSGMLPATMLANILHLPLVDVWEFNRLSGSRWMIAGDRFGHREPQGGKVLVVDDSVYKGTTFRQIRDYAERSDAKEWFDFQFATIYRWPHTECPIDFYARDVESPRYFEWNIFQHGDLSHAMLDIDGVLCLDPEPFDDDGPEYVRALELAKPLHVPKVKVHSLVSCRLDRWRTQTEQWMKFYRVNYGRLHLHEAATAADRRAGRSYGEWKGEHYKNSTATLFVESSAGQAPEIAAVSGKPVICLEDSKVYQ